jgi:hypothetical protein
MAAAPTDTKLSKYNTVALIASPYLWESEQIQLTGAVTQRFLVCAHAIQK